MPCGKAGKHRFAQLSKRGGLRYESVAMHAMILCAGLGTRLRPLTDERPKPLIPLNDRPLASHAIDVLAAAGVRHLVANAHHLAEQIDPGLRPWAEASGMSLRVLTESCLFGTGGGIRNALPHLASEFVVFNGDVFAVPDLGRAIAVHRATEARITLIVRDDRDARKLGAIEVTDDHRVVRILGEGPVPTEAVHTCMFTGVYVVSAALADDLPIAGCVVRHTLRRLMARGERVSAIVDGGPWFDLGTPRSYAETQFAILRGELALPGGQRCKGPMIGRGVAVGEAEVIGDEVCLGRDAIVTGTGPIARSIVWDGATVLAPCTNAIVGRGCRVDLGAS